LFNSLPVASSTVAALLLIAALAVFESGLTALSRRRSGAVPDALARLQADSRRMRQAAGSLRLALLAALLALSVAGSVAGSPSTALVSACGLALLYALERAGRLRAFGARGTALGPLVARLLYPLFVLMPRRGPLPPGDGPADPSEAAEVVEDIADRIAVAPEDRQQMVQGLLALEQTCVEDIMVPRSEVVGIDIQADWDEILDLVARTPHTRCRSSRARSTA
jgi:hypothetical protein